MFNGLADKYHIERGKTVGKWMAQVGSTLWNIIAVAIPQSLASFLLPSLIRTLLFLCLLPS